MLFSLLKFYARLILPLYCRKLVVNKPAYLNLKGPVLYAANHPNSFLDGIVLTTITNGKLYSLARGDAFGSRWKGLLRKMHLRPVYRTSEGVANLAQNYTTFSECHEVFEQGHSVLIFSEGRCVNEWKLRPLRKGTARLAISAWEKGIDLTVIPLGFNYSSFKSYGKEIHLLFGEPLNRQSITAHIQEGKQHFYFNQQLQQQLQQLVYDIPPGDEAKRRKYFSTTTPLVKKLLLALPAALGMLLHTPLYGVMQLVARSFKEADHYDGVQVALVLLFYPLYLLLAVLVASLFVGLNALWLVVLLPFCAWAAVQVRDGR